MILLVNDRAPLVMPEQTLVWEAISGVVLGASVMVLRLVSADECFSQASISYREAVWPYGCDRPIFPSFAQNADPCSVFHAFVQYPTLRVVDILPHQLAFFTPGMLPARAFRRNWNYTQRSACRPLDPTATQLTLAMRKSLSTPLPFAPMIQRFLICVGRV